MAQLVILGHKTRSKEVIEILEMLGGRNSRDYVCNVPGYAYSINDQGIIDLYISHSNSSITFTLEEFLEKFPYKVGDKVLRKPYVEARRICEMKWDSDYNYIKYGIGVGEWFNVSQIQLYEEETMEENTDVAFAPDLKGQDYSGRRFGYKIPKGYEFECVRNNEIILKPIKPQYPKTYEECCKVLNLTKYPPALVPNKVGFITQYEDFPYYYEIQKLAQLLVCRNAYWKIAGEQMGLGKPWEPDTCQIVYSIGRDSNRISLCDDMFGGYFILEFPTKEMRDAFYENFKDSIEQCKELL